MKRPTPASLKKVTPENLLRLGPERLAELLAAAAETKPELKRRLRMELAAEQGPEHLLPEIDRRLAALSSSRSRVSWRQRPTFIRDVDALRELIAAKLAGLDPAAGLDRMWRFMEVHRRVSLRLHDRHGELAAAFGRAAEDIGRLSAGAKPEDAGAALAQALAGDPLGWAGWLPGLLEAAPAAVAAATLHALSERSDATPAWTPLVRRLADAAGEVDAFRATFTPAALKDPSVAAEIGRRLLGAGRWEEAGRVLEAARSRRAGEAVDFEWESAWIDFLESAGRAEAAQDARWTSFERTLSAERARAFTSRLPDFDDVEAEERAFALAAAHGDFRAGLAFLMGWPALAEAARMIEARAEEVDASPEQVELWAAQLEARYPAAAHLLLRKAAAAAFRRRDLVTCKRLTRAADAMGA